MGSDRSLSKRHDPIRTWARHVVASAFDRCPSADPLDIVRSVATEAWHHTPLADSDRRPFGSSGAGVRRIADGMADSNPPGGWANPWLVGVVHEHAVSLAERQSRGAWYTPRSVVEGLVGFAANATSLPGFALDPTCGGGAFLLAVLDHWVALGLDPADAITRVAGTDIDPDAVLVCTWSLQLWAANHNVVVDSITLDVSVADALLDEVPERWPDRRLVLGNPPFASPLRKGAIPATAVHYRDSHRQDLGQYADLAALHLHRAVSSAGPGSVVMMVMPQSVLSSRDVASLREQLQSKAATIGLWAAREAIFDAGVRACAPLVVVDAVPDDSNDEVHLARGSAVDNAGTSGKASWSSYGARALGAPDLPTAVNRPALRLDQLCTATAGFRDEYYGLLAACVEASEETEPENRLVTVGSVEPLITTWGSRPLRFGGRHWNRPSIDPTLLDAKVARWWDRQAVSKLVVATQSKTLEPVLDRRGQLVPATPLLSVHAEADDLAYVAAVLLAPPVVAMAWERWFGSAMAVDALKLAASQLAELPLPSDRRSWERAAELVAGFTAESAGEELIRQGWSCALEVARLMNTAFGAGEDVMAWWLARLPRSVTAETATAVDG